MTVTYRIDKEKRRVYFVVKHHSYIEQEVLLERQAALGFDPADCGFYTMNFERVDSIIIGEWWCYETQNNNLVRKYIQNKTITRATKSLSKYFKRFVESEVGLF